MEKNKKDTLAKPDLKDGLKAIAEWYFITHEDLLEQMDVSEILIAQDGEVFYGNVKGENAASNYCSANKFLDAKRFKK
ncbi:MAG: hypothetical protein ACKO96_35660 [Flammeovirgaceae bacterium]